MSIRKKDLLDIELMSYTDIAYELIKEDKKQYTTPDLFKEVCSLLQLSEEEYAEKIGDFFTALTTDGRFVLLDSINWDLRDNHVIKVVVDDGDDDELDVSEEDEDGELSSEDEDIEDDYSDESVDTSADEEDDMKDLTILDEEELEE